MKNINVPVAILAATLLCLLNIFWASPTSAAQWLTMETPHFSVHFEKGQEAVAGQAAAIAEQAYIDLSQSIGHAPEGKIQLVLADITDSANGMVVPYFFNLAVINVVYPTTQASYASGLSTRYESWFKLAIYHELTHVFHMDINSGLAGWTRKTFGHVPVLSTPLATASGAVLEGYAVYQETRVAGGGRGGDAFFDMFLRAQTLDGRLPKLDQFLADYGLDGWQPGGVTYLYGWSLLNFVADVYGEEILKKVNEGYGSFYELGYISYLARVVQTTPSRLYTDWKSYLEKKYAQQAAELKSQGLTESRSLTRKKVAVEPEVSPDGEWVAYSTLSTKGVLPQLRVVSKDGSVDREVAPVDAAFGNKVSWSPDGEKIVYAEQDNVDPMKEFGDLYVADLRSGKRTRLSRGLRADGPSWSPDGREIAFVSREGLQTSLKIMEVSTRRIHTILTGTDETQYALPAWSPDGKRIALQIWRWGGFQDIAVVGADGQAADGPAADEPGLRFLTQDKATDRSPSWSRDGRYVLFDSDRTGVNNLFACDLESGKLYRITNLLYGAFDPVVTPDGSKIIFSSYSVSGYDLQEMAFDPSRWVETGWQAETPPVAAKFEAAYPVHPYNPFETAAPKWWLPVVLPDYDGVQFGAVTAGMDALGAIVYTAEAHYSTASGMPGYNLAGTVTPGWAGNPSLFLTLSDITWPHEDKNSVFFVRNAIQSFGVFYPFPHNRSASSLSFGVQLDEAAWVGSPLEMQYRGLFGEFDHRRVSGHNEWLRRSAESILLALEAEGDQSLSYKTGEVLIDNGLFHRGIERLSLRVAGGVSEASGRFEIGGSGSWQPVRGVATSTLSGNAYGFASAEAWPVRIGIQRGWRDLPIFLDDLSFGGFVDAGAAWDLGSPWNREVLSSVGVETKLKTSLLYGIAAPEIRLGYAYPLDGEKPQLFLTLGSLF
ncbi:MAG: hypothetical protein M1379_08530 [Firmicutes bacterium]|nr:hypothetical protein [Bacillota bacterium]